MKLHGGVETAVGLMILTFAICLATQAEGTHLPAPGNNKVAYYVFDSGGPDHYPLTSFTDEANVVVLFEGKLWELADTLHYDTGWMRNIVYHSYSEILRDVRILQARGVKVLMNVDDAASWSTATPFTTFDGIPYNYQQFAAFMKSCAIDSLHLDGISLDVEHGATGNAAYIGLLKEIGKYFGPRSPDSASQMYIAAIYSGGAPANVIGKSIDVASYFSFVMDMAYFNSNYTRRFNQWADSIGASKTMIGVLNDYFDLAYATNVARWQPASPPKAGIMVYAANNLKSYTDSVFRALVGSPAAVEVGNTPGALALLQNYPNPFNPKTVISCQLTVASRLRLAVYDMLGREVAVLMDEQKQPGEYTVTWDATGFASGVYIYRLAAGQFAESKTMVLCK